MLQAIQQGIIAVGCKETVINISEQCSSSRMSPGQHPCSLQCLKSKSRPHKARNIKILSLLLFFVPTDITLTFSNFDFEHNGDRGTLWFWGVGSKAGAYI